MNTLFIHNFIFLKAIKHKHHQRVSNSQLSGAFWNRVLNPLRSHKHKSVHQCACGSSCWPSKHCPDIDQVQTCPLNHQTAALPQLVNSCDNPFFLAVETDCKQIGGRHKIFDAIWKYCPGFVRNWCSWKWVFFFHSPPNEIWDDRFPAHQSGAQSLALFARSSVCLWWEMFDAVIESCTTPLFRCFGFLLALNRAFLILFWLRTAIEWWFFSGFLWEKRFETIGFVEQRDLQL